MKKVLLCVIGSAALTLPFAAAADAAPVTVNLRVEGATSTIYEGPVTTDVREVDGHDGSGAHPCDGTAAGVGPGPTMTTALDDASRQGAFAWKGTWYSFGDFLIDTIGADSGTSFSSYWGTALDFAPTAFGGCGTLVQDGSEALYALGDVYSQDLLRLIGPARVARGQSFEVQAVNGNGGAAEPGATVGGGVTDTTGKVSLSLPDNGIFKLKAEKPGTIRSNAITVCVSDDGNGDCGIKPPVKVKDSAAPVAGIAGIKNKQRFRRGPRLLHGTASDAGSGISVVKLSLRRHLRGRCNWWSKSAERFSGKNCRKPVFFSIGNNANWSYQLAKPLGPGRYVLDVKVADRAGNVDSARVAGRNRVVFTVGHGGAKATASASIAPVQVMVVGKDGKPLVDAREVTPKAVRVKVGKRRCKVAASTPLAALAAATKGKLRIGLKDFGSCSKRTVDSAQLFVRSIGSQRNSGQDGWEYMKGDKIPSIGAADRTAKLAAGSQLRWFYCVHDSSGECQPALFVAGPIEVLSAGGSFLTDVRQVVRGVSSPAPGATVSIGPASATTDAAGRTSIQLPAAGEYELRATRPGALPAFPVKVRVFGQ